MIWPEAMMAHPGGSLLQQPAGFSNPYAGMVSWMGTPEMDALNRITNPLYYMERITVPKMVVMDINDEWMDGCIEDVATWFPRLPGPKTLLFVEAKHDTTVVASYKQVAAFIQGHLHHQAVPGISHTFDRGTGRLAVRQASAHSPTKVRFHSATSCALGMSSLQGRASFVTAQWTNSESQVSRTA